MNKFESFIKNTAKDKKKLLMLFLAVLGVFMILASSWTEEKESDASSLSQYKAELEEELSQLCESIEGAGKCRVSVSFSSGESFEYHGSSISGSAPPKVLGVTVVCEGGDKSKVKADICDCMMSLFDIGSNRVCVLAMK